jgi:LCP family protein required for cell wall assembly
MSTKNKNPKGGRNGATGRDSRGFLYSVKKAWTAMRKGQKAAVIVALAFLVLIGTGIWYYASVIDNPIDSLKPNDPIFDPTESKDIEKAKSDDELDNYLPEEYFQNNIVNFALLGFDTNEERRQMDGESWYGQKGFAGARPDSIRVVSVNLDTMKASVISIPRDTYVQIADTNTKQKINASYMYGRQAGRKISNDEKEINRMGMQYVCQTISNVLGRVPIQYYMAIDFDTIVNFVDEIGGVEYNVEHTIYHPREGFVMLDKGQQVLNGTQVFIYLQDRTSVGSDFARTSNHTKFLLAMVKQLKQSDKLVEAIKFITLGGFGTVDTNMTAKEILAAGNLARKLDIDNDVKSYIIEGKGQMMDGVSYVTMNQAKRAQVIKEVFGFDIKAEPDEVLQDTVPAAPRNFTATVTGDGVVLDWSPGDSNNRGYNLWRNGTLIANGITEDMYLDTEYPGGALTYELQAVNGDAVSSKVSVSLNVSGGPGAPTNFKAVYDADDGVVRLTWEYAGDRATFTLYKSDGNGTGNRLDRRITSRSYTDSDVEVGKTYTYRVVAVDSDGKESPAATVQITVGASSSPTPTPPADSFEVIVSRDLASPADSGSPLGSGYYLPGTQVTIKANPKEGFEFVKWIGGPVDGSDDSTKTFTMPSYNVTITALYEAIATPSPSPSAEPSPSPSAEPSPSPEPTTEPTTSPTGETGGD